MKLFSHNIIPNWMQKAAMSNMDKPREWAVMSCNIRERPLLHICETKIDWLIVLGLTTRQPLRVILCRLQGKERKEIEEIVVEMNERDREERGTGMKVKKQKK